MKKPIKPKSPAMPNPQEALLRYIMDMYTRNDRPLPGWPVWDNIDASTLTDAAKKEYHNNLNNIYGKLLPHVANGNIEAAHLAFKIAGQMASLR
ncbi:MAG: hypothetical protein ACYCSQ_05125 [bacterium]